MLRSTVSIALAAVALGTTTVAAAPAGAQDAAGLTFRDTRPLTLRPEALSGAAGQLTVCNGGATTATKLRAAASGFGFQDAAGDDVADAAVVGRPVLRRSSLAPGACLRVRLGADAPPDLASGSYTGAVTVSSAGQGVARRELTIAGPAATVVAPQAVVDTVKIKVTHHWGPLNFLFGSGDHGADVPLSAPQPGRTLRLAGHCRKGDRTPSDACPTVGVVAHNDETGQLALAGPLGRAKDGVAVLPVRLHGAGAIGDYTGSLDPGHTYDDNTSIKVVVSVTQWWPWALLALLLGGALVLWPQWFTRRTRPAGKVRDHATGLARRYDDALNAFHAGGRFTQIIGPAPGNVEAYAAGIVAALRSYLGGMVFLDTSTDTYKAIDRSLRNADDDIACLARPDQLRASLDDLATTLGDLLRWLGERRFSDHEPAVATAAAKVLAAQELRVGAACRLKADADAQVATLDSWKDLAERLLRCQLWWREMAVRAALKERAGGLGEEDTDRHTVAGARLAQAKADLLKAADAGAIADRGIRKRLAGVYDELGYLGGRYGVEEPPADGAFVELRDFWAADEAPVYIKNMLSMPSVPKVVTTLERLVGRATAVDRTAATPAVVAPSRRWLGDVLCIALALIVAILGAMVGIVGNKNFGTLSDWATVVLIGTAAQGVVSGIIPTVNAALQDRFGSVLVAAAAESEPVPAPA
jgi:hypothetical protein